MYFDICLQVLEIWSFHHMPTSLHWVVLFASHSILHTSKGQVWKKGCRLWQYCSLTVSTASLFYLFTHYATGSCLLLLHLMDWAWLAFRFVCKLHIVLHWHNCRKVTSELPGTRLKQLQIFFLIWVPAQWYITCYLSTLCQVTHKASSDRPDSRSMSWNKLIINYNKL